MSSTDNKMIEVEADVFAAPLFTGKFGTHKSQKIYILTAYKVSSATLHARRIIGMFLYKTDALEVVDRDLAEVIKKGYTLVSLEQVNSGILPEVKDTIWFVAEGNKMTRMSANDQEIKFASILREFLR